VNARAPDRRSFPALPAASAADVAEEAAILERLRRRDLEGLARAFDRWHQRVRVLARRLLSDAAAAEDVVQEVFAALPSAVLRFRGDANLETFLLGIAVKRAGHHRRAAARRQRARARLVVRERGGPRDPEQETYRRELGLRLAAALDQLPLPQRIAFVLCEIEDLTSAQAAAIAGVPEATVRTRLHHARRRLRDWLDEEREP
jgi:RNA polymerase sigma-70 factor (ECF subfamily)